MRKVVIFLICLGLLTALGLPATADVDVSGEVTKTKVKTVTENVTITKTYDVTVIPEIFVFSSAESQVVKNELNTDNYVYEDTNSSVADITGGFEGVEGIVGINQAPGNMNNQGNVASVGLGGYDGFLHSEACVDMINGVDPEAVDMDMYTSPNEIESYLSDRSGLIDATGAVDGIVGINQASGHMNNQNNVASVAAGIFDLGEAAALTEADLGLVCADNLAIEIDVIKTDSITAAFDGSSGIIGINQSSGCMNNQANVVSIAALPALE